MRFLKDNAVNNAMAATQTITAPQLLKKSQMAPPPIKEGMIMTIPIPRHLADPHKSLLFCIKLFYHN